jgi:hypothetical protein
LYEAPYVLSAVGLDVDVHPLPSQGGQKVQLLKVKLLVHETSRLQKDISFFFF